MMIRTWENEKAGKEERGSRPGSSHWEADTAANLPGGGVRRGPSEGGRSGPEPEQRRRPRTRWLVTGCEGGCRGGSGRKPERRRHPDASRAGIELTTETSAERIVPRAQRVRGWGVTGRRRSEGAAWEVGMEGGGARRPGPWTPGEEGTVFKGGKDQLGWLWRQKEALDLTPESPLLTWTKEQFWWNAEV